MSTYKLYTAMKNMIALAIPGHDWTDEAGEQALQDARAACEAYDARLKAAFSNEEDPEVLRRIWQAWNNCRDTVWKADRTDGMLSISGHDTVEFDDGHHAEFCAILHESMRELMMHVLSLADRTDTLRAEIIAQKDGVAKRDQTIAAQSYIISKLDSIIYAIENPDLLRMIAEIDARQVAERRVTVLEMLLERVKKVPGVRQGLAKATDDAIQSAIDALRIDERNHDH